MSHVSRKILTSLTFALTCSVALPSHASLRLSCQSEVDGLFDLFITQVELGKTNKNDGVYLLMNDLVHVDDDSTQPKKFNTQVIATEGGWSLKVDTNKDGINEVEAIVIKTKGTKSEGLAVLKQVETLVTTKITCIEGN